MHEWFDVKFWLRNDHDKTHIAYPINDRRCYRVVHVLSGLVSTECHRHITKGGQEMATPRGKYRAYQGKLKYHKAIGWRHCYQLPEDFPADQAILESLREIENIETIGTS